MPDGTVQVPNYRQAGDGTHVFGTAPVFERAPVTTVDVGAVNGAALAAAELGDGVMHKTVITMTNLVITMTDAGANGCHGAHKCYDWPEGRVLIHGAHAALAIAAGAGGITDTAALVCALGSAQVGVDNATLTSTEANVIASTNATLSGGAGAFEAVSGTALVHLDGSSTAADLFLNCAVPDAGSTADDTLTCNGTITLLWSLLGDD